MPSEANTEDQMKLKYDTSANANTLISHRLMPQW